MILRLSKLATPAVVDRTNVPETSPVPVARVTVIEYLDDWLFAEVRRLPNSSRSVTCGTRLKVSPRFLFSVCVVGTLDSVRELGTPYSGEIPSTVPGVKDPEFWVKVRDARGEFSARFPEIALVVAGKLIVCPA